MTVGVCYLIIKLMKKTKAYQTVIQPDSDLSDNDDNHIIQAGIQKLTEESTTFQFLIDDEDIYTKDAIKEKY